MELKLWKHVGTQAENEREEDGGVIEGDLGNTNI
jgi:hypothetical protein